MKADFVNPFLLSLLNVLSTMAQMELKPGAPKRKTDELARGDVSGLIGMVGPQTRGSLSISFEKGLALEIMRRMLGEKGYEFDMATPIIVSGPNHTITHRADGAKIMMPFESEYGRATIEICFE